MKTFLTNFLLILSTYLVAVALGQPATTEPATTEPDTCVVINEVVHKPVAGEEDWIEFFNLCDEMVDLSGYFIRDSNPESLFMLGDPSKGCVNQIAARGYMLLYRNDVCSFDFGLGSDDQVTFLDPNLLELDTVVWTKTDAREGKSWARLPSGRGSFQTTNPTPGEFNGVSLIVPEKVVTSVEEVTVIINELVNSPVAPEEDWIEFYNYGTAPVDLTGLRLTDEATNPGDGFYFGQPGCEADTVIQPQEFKVLDRMSDENPCSFEFGFGDNDQAILWFDLDNIIDSTAFGPKNNGSLVPTEVSWGRLPNGVDGTFTTLVPTKGSANEVAITGDDLVLKIANDLINQKS